MPYARIESALGICKSHVDSIDNADPNKVEIEAYVVSGLILLVVSEYETLIESIFIARADRCGDVHVANYIRTAVARRFRSPDLNKITDFLGQFGNDYKQSFSDKILNTDAHAAWDNILRARHAVVHKSGTLNITLTELLATYPKTKMVISELKSTLGVP